MASRFTIPTMAILMVARQFISPVYAYTRPKKANIDSNSQHPSMKRVGFKDEEDMRSLTNRGFNLEKYSTGCKVDENGYYKGCKYTEQGITIWPTIAFNNEDGYQYYFEYGWTTCNELIAQVKLDYFREGWEKKKQYQNLVKTNWTYGELDRKGFTVNVCYQICINTPGCAYFFFQTQNPGVDSDMHGVPLETSCELHRGCSEPRTALYPGTTFEILDVELDCLDTCYGYSCEHYVKNGNYTCAELEGISFHCDCSGCDCVNEKADALPEKKAPSLPKLLPEPVPEPKPNKTKVCRGFWDKPRNLDDPQCNTPPLSPWGGNLEHQICPGFVPGYTFMNTSCTGTAANCTAGVVCDRSSGYTGTPKVSCDVDGAKFNVTGCSRGDLVTVNGKIFRYFTHLDCAQGNIHVVGLSTTGNPAGKTFSLMTPLECAEECNKWTAKHPENKCKAFSMGNGACKANHCERVTPDMCYNHCSESRRCVLKNLEHCSEHLQRDLTYDLWWNIEDTSLKGYDQCSYRFAGNNTKGRKPDGGEDDKSDYNSTHDKVIFGSTRARPGKMDCVRDYGVAQNPESARLKHMNFGVWDRDGI